MYYHEFPVDILQSIEDFDIYHPFAEIGPSYLFDMPYSRTMNMAYQTNN